MTATSASGGVTTVAWKSAAKSKVGASSSEWMWNLVCCQESTLVTLELHPTAGEATGVISLSNGGTEEHEKGD